MLTEKDYCDYETCVALKELGYKGISRFFYATKESPLRRYSYDQILTTRIADAVGHTLAISLYVAQKWLREEKNIEANASFDKKDNGWITFIQRLDYPDLCGTDVLSTVYNTYEAALSEGIKEAIKILKDGNGI